jgi:hypothetical protein
MASAAVKLNEEERAELAAVSQPGIGER